MTVPASPPQMPPQAPPPAPSMAPPVGIAPGPKTSGLALASLIVGISSICLAWIPVVGMVSIALGIGAIVLGFLANKQISAQPHILSGKGLAVGGMVTGGIGVVVALLWLLVIGAIITGANAAFSEM